MCMGQQKNMLAKRICRSQPICKGPIKGSLACKHQQSIGQQLRLLRLSGTILACWWSNIRRTVCMLLSQKKL